MTDRIIDYIIFSIFLFYFFDYYRLKRRIKKHSAEIGMNLNICTYALFMIQLCSFVFFTCATGVLLISTIQAFSPIHLIIIPFFIFLSLISFITLFAMYTRPSMIIFTDKEMIIYHRGKAKADFFSLQDTCIDSMNEEDTVLRNMRHRNLKMTFKSWNITTAEGNTFYITPSWYTQKQELEKKMLLLKTSLKSKPSIESEYDKIINSYLDKLDAKKKDNNTI